MTPSTAASVISLTSTDTGRCGENLTAYHLERAGIACSLVDRRGSDIWCCTPGGVLFRLEVKTATAPTNRSKTQVSYSYRVATRVADWFAFVALDKELILFQPVSELMPYTTHRFEPEMFKPAVMFNSMAKMIETVEQRKAA